MEALHANNSYGKIKSRKKSLGKEKKKNNQAQSRKKYLHFAKEGSNVNFMLLFLIYHEIQITIKQNSYTKANESGEEAQKETMRLIDIGLPQSKNKVNINGKAWIESKIQ